MSDPSGPWQMWTRRLLAIFTLHKLRDAKNNVRPQLPEAISMSAIVSVENALREIPLGISGARTGIRAFLNVIKEINVTAATDERTLRRLERDIRLLAEVLEPLGYTESYLFSPELLHQLRRLGRKLQDISQRMKQSMSSRENRRRFFSSHPENTGGDPNSFAEGFHLALDKFRDCTANVFSEHDGGGGAPIGYCIQLVMCPTSLFGLGPTIQTGDGSPLRSHPNWLLNGRGIENWLEIEITATSTRGIVTFSPTNEALVRGAVVNSHYPIVVGDPGQSMTWRSGSKMA